MTASFLPPILTPIVTLVFPGLAFALFFVLIEQEEVVVLHALIFLKLTLFLQKHILTLKLGGLKIIFLLF
jgi:hypothetical protein